MKTDTFKIELKKLFVLVMFFGAYTVFSQTPDLRNCGYGCTTNSFSIQSVFLSATNVPGTTLSNTSCQSGTSQSVYMIAEITSNRNSPVYDARIFGDLVVGSTTLTINKYLGTLPASNSGITQRLVYGPFNWTCGETLTLKNLLVVWKTSPQSSIGANGPYDCGSYSNSQCQFPSDLLVSTPLGVQYDYTACTTGSTALVTFQSTTNGGTPPYTYLWNYDGGIYQGGTASAPIVLYNLPGTYNPTLKVTDSQGNSNLLVYSETLVFPSQLTITTSNSGVTCGSNNGSGSFTGSGGTPPYTFNITTNTTGASTFMNGPPTTILSFNNAGAGTITVKITDAVGCTATASINVASGDNQAPVITGAISPTTIEGCNLSAAPLGQDTVAGLEGLPGNLSVTDNITPDANLTVKYYDSVSGTCPIVITRTYTVYDQCNNVSSSFTHVITIQDTTPPNIDTAPADISVQCVDDVPAPSDLNWSDNCDAGGTVTSSDGPLVGGACGGTITRTWNVSDACGNPAAARTQIITVNDTTPPNIDTAPADISVQCIDDVPAPSDLELE